MDRQIAKRLLDQLKDVRNTAVLFEKLDRDEWTEDEFQARWKLCQGAHNPSAAMISAIMKVQKSWYSPKAMPHEYGLTGDRQEQYYREAHRVLRISVFKRDAFTCMGCGFVSETKPQGGDLEMHHHRYYPDEHQLMFDCVTLCQKCHRIVHARGAGGEPRTIGSAGEEASSA